MCVQIRSVTYDIFKMILYKKIRIHKAEVSFPFGSKFHYSRHRVFYTGSFYYCLSLRFGLHIVYPCFRHGNSTGVCIPFGFLTVFGPKISGSEVQLTSFFLTQISTILGHDSH